MILLQPDHRDSPLPGLWVSPRPPVQRTTNSPDHTGGGGKTGTPAALGSMNNLQQFRKSSMDVVCWSGAQQDAVWNRQHVANHLARCCASITQVFWKHSQDLPGRLAYPDACAVLAIALTPKQAARPTHPRLNAALRREDRHRGIAAACIRLQLLWSWRHTCRIRHQTLPAARCPPTPTRIEWHLLAVPSSASGSAPQVFVLDSTRRECLSALRAGRSHLFRNNRQVLTRGSA